MNENFGSMALHQNSHRLAIVLPCMIFTISHDGFSACIPQCFVYHRIIRAYEIKFSFTKPISFSSHILRQHPMIGMKNFVVLPQTVKMMEHLNALKSYPSTLLYLH